MSVCCQDRWVEILWVCFGLHLPKVSWDPAVGSLGLGYHKVGPFWEKHTKALRLTCMDIRRKIRKNLGTLIAPGIWGIFRIKLRYTPSRLPRYSLQPNPKLERNTFLHVTVRPTTAGPFMTRSRSWTPSTSSNHSSEQSIQSIPAGTRPPTAFGLEKLHAFDGALQHTVRLCNMYFILLDLIDIQPHAHAWRKKERERESK